MVETEGATPPEYRVSYSEFARSALRELVQKAGQLGLRSELLAALRALEQSLRSRPLDLGEPLRDLKNLGLQERQGNSGFLFVRYAVDSEAQLGYVLNFAAIGHGF